MAKVVCKGTVLDQEIGSTLTPVAQIISIDASGAESETTDVTTLDTTGAGKEYLATGYTEGGSIDFELFFDPALAGHQALTDDLTVPAERDYSIQFADSGSNEWTFTSAGIGMGFTVDMNDALRASFSLKLDQLFGYTT